MQYDVRKIKFKIIVESFFSQEDKSTIEAEDKPSLSGIFKEAEVVVTNVEAEEMMGQWLALFISLNLGP